ncbi:MAG: hypothetical protein RL220_1703 [Bacteroidota bacterium]
MITTDIQVSPEIFLDQKKLKGHLASHWRGKGDFDFHIDRKSIDARGRSVKFSLRVTLFDPSTEPFPVLPVRSFEKLSDDCPVAVIAGTGPAGLFAALRLIELGIRPIMIERGKDVRARRRDLAALNKNHELNPESNYCFGEGGAGTYSDGKLYTRSNKRGDIGRILRTFVQFGAGEEILSDAHPHIGTNKLPGIIAAMREGIIEAGGEVHFNSRLTGLKVSDGKLVQVSVNNSMHIPCEHLILATGHSATDIFELLHQEGLAIEFKSFALGVRIEHPQRIIDEARYHLADRPDYLPPASYNLVCQVDGRGVYSFCMCPGGIIAPCATEPEQVVTNGWSPSKRNNPWANSGMVVPVFAEDLDEFKSYGPLAGLKFQRKVEHDCWVAGGRSQVVPAQRAIDFVNGRPSTDLPSCSYVPGVLACRLDQILPGFIVSRLKKALREFGKKVPGYLHPDALLVAPESRTSSPVRIPRDEITCEHPDASGLYPCGEGAGYAGGIVSAAMDGERVAEAISLKISQRH